MKTIHQTVMLCIVCASAVAAFAQGGPSSGEQQVAGTLAYLFSKSPSFTAMALTSVKDGSGRETKLESAFTVSAGNVRMEMDLTKAAPQSAEQMKKMGMDRTVHISRPDKNLVYMIYPGLNAYCEIPLSKEPPKGDAKPVQMEKTEVGKDVIDGHPCVKSNVVISTDEGKKVEGTIWEATDLGNTPIQSEFTTSGVSVKSSFKDIKLGAVDNALFEPPQGFQKYATMKEMMMAEMMKKMGK